MPTVRWGAFTSSCVRSVGVDKPVARRMSDATLTRLRIAVADAEVVGRYWSHVLRSDDPACWVWTGAISGRGHGRFQIADDYFAAEHGRVQRQTFVVIAHRFGFAVKHGVDALLAVPALAHRCDNPLCQKPAHWRESNHRANGQEYAVRRDQVRGNLADSRGARGRARAVRDAARGGLDVDVAVAAGWLPVHRDQHDLFELGEC